MNHALLVSRLERRGDLLRDRQRLLHRNRPLVNPIRERRPFDQFQHERVHATRFLQAVNRTDIRMIQRGQNLRFALEARQPIDIEGEDGREDLECDVAIQGGIAALIDLSHPAAADKSGDMEMASEDSTCAEAVAGGRGGIEQGVFCRISREHPGDGGDQQRVPIACLIYELHALRR